MGSYLTTPILQPSQPPPDPEVDAQVAELKRLRFKHPTYEVFAPRWDFYLSAYEGGEEFADEKNLFKHVRENNDDYKDRAQRIHNLNYCEAIVDFFTNFIFAESITRRGGSNEEWYENFTKDVNKRGDSVDAFMRQLSSDNQVYGMVYVMVDTPPLPITSEDPNAVAPVITKQYEQDNGIRPYWVSVKPVEVLDWVIDDYGQLTYLKRCQLVNEMRNGQRLSLERYLEYYIGKAIVTEVDTTVPSKPRILPAQEYDTPFKQIPFVVSRFKRSNKYPYVGLSFLRDLAYNQREIMNLTSLLQEFLYRQAFNILAKETDGTIPLREQEQGLIGTNNVIDVPKGAKMPVYITPPVAPAEAIANERLRIKNEMFTRASQDAMNELFNGEGSSGWSQQQSFSKTVPFIASRADELEAVENQLMQLTAEAAGLEWDGTIKYKDRYELTNLTAALSQFQILCRDLQIDSEDFVKTQLKRFVHEFDGKMPTAVQIAVDQQIDAMNFTAWQDTQKQALIGSPAKDKLSNTQRSTNGGGVKNTETEAVSQ